MKRGFTYVTALSLAMIVLFNACSVQKRHYRPGFHFEAAQKKTPKTEVKETAAPIEETTAPVETATIPETVSVTENATASTTTEATVAQRPVVKINKNKHSNANTAVATPVKEKGSKKIGFNSQDKKGYKAGPKGILGILGDDKLIAILLCIFLGWLGIHRFYLGYPISALIMILLFILSSVGWFFIGPLGYIAGLLLFVWIIIDLIFLITDRALFFQS